MYHDFYQLKENPFNVTADPHFFYASPSHGKAISSLAYGIEQRKGILALTGEVGTGKTMICRKLLKQSTKRLKFAFILNQNFSELELLQMIVQDLGVWTREKNKFGIVRALNKFLIKEAAKNHNIVLLIDEAQNLSVDQLEQIRLLSNFETEKEKLLQIILIGQPELDGTLQLSELRQLRQRIAIYVRITPLEKNDIKVYIQHRITKVMANPDSIHHIIFNDFALEAIYHHTQGTPRKINILCDRVLLAGFVNGTYLIDEHIVENCAKEVMHCEYHL